MQTVIPFNDEFNVILTGAQQQTEICFQMGCGNIAMDVNEFEAFRKHILH
jgi:hypothetical protein